MDKLIETGNLGLHTWNNILDPQTIEMEHLTPNQLNYIPGADVVC